MTEGSYYIHRTSSVSVRECYETFGVYGAHAYMNFHLGTGEQPLCVSDDRARITTSPHIMSILRWEMSTRRALRSEPGEMASGGSEGTIGSGKTRREKNRGVEGTISWGFCASLPVCVNQQAAHGCNEVENKKNIKMSEWNKRQGEIFYDEPKFSLLCNRSSGQLSLSSPDTVHHPSVCISSQITQIIPPAIHVIYMEWIS